jgi:hypothetical protein
MLAQIRKLRRPIASIILLAAAGTLISCASQKQSVALVNDPDAKPESQMPWDKQEKWETGGDQFANLTDHR